MICKHLHCVYSLPWLDVVHIWLGYAVFYDDTGAFGHLGCTTNIYDVNMLPAVKITKHTVTKRCGGVVTPRRLAAKLSVTEAIAIKVTKCDHQQPLVGKSVVSDIANVNCCDENTSDLPDYHHCFERDPDDVPIQAADAVQMCNNCKCRPVAREVMCGFDDWCERCDLSLYSTRQYEAKCDERRFTFPTTKPVVYHQQPLVGKSVVSDIANGDCCDGNTSDLPDYHHCFERDHHDPLNDHNCFQDCCFIAIGRANVKVHTHSLGLAQVFFKNCVVKVRLGEDLDLLVGLSRSGHVHLHNIQTNGWIVTDATLLPSFVFLRWLSSMVQI